MDEQLEVADRPFPNSGKLEKVWKTCSFMLLQPLWGAQFCLGLNQGKKDDRSAQTVQDEASLSPAATRALLGGAETPNWQCARQSQRFGDDPAAGGEEDCNHTRAALLGPFRGNIASSHECGVLQDLLTSAAAVSDYSVCGVPVSSKA